MQSTQKKPPAKEIAAMARVFGRPLFEGKIGEVLEFMRRPTGVISQEEKILGVGSLLSCTLSGGWNPFMDGKISKNAEKALSEFVRGNSPSEEKLLAAKIRVAHILAGGEIASAARIAWNARVRTGERAAYVGALHELFYSGEENARLALDAITRRMFEAHAARPRGAPEYVAGGPATKL